MANPMNNLMTNTNTYIKTIPMSYTTTDHVTDTIIDPIAKPKTDPMMMIVPMTEQNCDARAVLHSRDVLSHPVSLSVY